MSAARRGKKKPPLTDEQRKQRSEMFKALWQSPGYREKLVAAAIRRSNTPEGKARLASAREKSNQRKPNVLRDARHSDGSLLRAEGPPYIGNGDQVSAG